MSACVEAGIAAELSEVGFAVHMPVPIPIAEKINLDEGEFRRYIEEARRLRQKYEGRIGILIGGEFDFMPDQLPEIERLANAYEYDFRMGSVHFIDDWNFDNPGYLDRWETADVEAVYRRYYHLMTEMAETGLFDIVGHFDLVKKFGFRPDRDISDAVAGAARAVADAGMTVEINSAGWHKPVGEQYPSEQILRLMYDLDVPICLGSDAHAPGQVGRDFDRAISLARRVGWSAVNRFSQRRTFAEPLPAAG